MPGTATLALAAAAGALHLMSWSQARAATADSGASPPAATTDSTAPVPATDPVAARLVRAGVPIEVELDELVTSHFAKPGDFVPLHLAHAVKAGDQVLVPAGVKGTAQVVHAARAGAAGRPGELILAGRYLEYNGQRLPIGHLHLGGEGRDKTGAALATSMAAGVAGFLVKGGEIAVPSGTRASAQITADVTLNPPADAAAPISTQEGSAP